MYCIPEAVLSRWNRASEGSFKSLIIRLKLLPWFFFFFSLLLLIIQRETRISSGQIHLAVIKSGRMDEQIRRGEMNQDA